MDKILNMYNMNITIYPVLYSNLPNFNITSSKRALTNGKHEIRTSQEDNFLRHQMF